VLAGGQTKGGLGGGPSRRTGNMGKFKNLINFISAGATTKNRKTGNYSTTRDTKAEEIDRIIVGYDDKGEAQYLIIKPHP